MLLFSFGDVFGGVVDVGLAVWCVWCGMIHFGLCSKIFQFITRSFERSDGQLDLYLVAVCERVIKSKSDRSFGRFCHNFNKFKGLL